MRLTSALASSLAFQHCSPTTVKTQLFARPSDCPPDVWEAVVEAERKSRQKKIGNFGAALGALDQGAIQKNQLRIWDELKKKKDLPPSPQPPEGQPSTPDGPFAGIRKAWNQIYEEADAMGKAQAIALSADLEDKGLLPRVVTANRTDTDLSPPLTSKKTSIFSTPPLTAKKTKKKRKRSSSQKSKGFG